MADAKPEMKPEAKSADVSDEDLSDLSEKQLRAQRSKALAAKAEEAKQKSRQRIAPATADEPKVFVKLTHGNYINGDFKHEAPAQPGDILHLPKSEAERMVRENKVAEYAT